MALAFADQRAPLSKRESSSRPPASSSTGGHAKRKSSSKDHKKNKASAIRRYLTLKEPSQSALDKLSAHHRLQVTAKDGALPGTGSYGVSQQKLPSTVPPVSSKWDGIPRSLSDRLPSRSGSAFTQIWPKFGVNSSRSIWSRSTGDTHAPTDSLGPSSTSGSKAQKGASLGTNHTMSSLPEMSYFFPDPPGSSGKPVPADASLHIQHVDER